MIEWISIPYKYPPNKKEVILTDGIYCCVNSIFKCDGINFIKFGMSGNMKIPTHWAKIPKKSDKDWISFGEYKPAKESILATDGKKCAILTYSSSKNKFPNISRYTNKITNFMYLPKLP